MKRLLLALLFSVIAWPSSAQVPFGGVPVSNSSGNVAAATAAATLPAAAGKITYLSGFAMTASGVTTALPVICTVTSVVGGTMSFIFTFPAGVLIGATPLVVAFPVPMPATAANTTIVVSCPTGGSGNTNAAMVAWGYQL